MKKLFLNNCKLLLNRNLNLSFILKLSNSNKMNFSNSSNNNNNNNNNNKKNEVIEVKSKKSKSKKENSDSIKNTGKYNKLSKEVNKDVKEKDKIIEKNMKEQMKDFQDTLENEPNTVSFLTDKEKESMLDFMEKYKSEKIEEKRRDEEEEKENERKNSHQSYPLIYFSQPLVPYSKVTINNPNKNDLFFGLLLKYGKLQVLDEDTTLIQDVCLYNTKEENFKYQKAGKDNIYGTMCEIFYKKGKLTIIASDTVYSISTYKPGKYTFFYPNESVKLNIKSPNISYLSSIPMFKNVLEQPYGKKQILELDTYIKGCLKYFESIIELTDLVNKNLDIEEDFFGDNNQTFTFKFAEIKKSLDFFKKEFDGKLFEGLIESFEMEKYKPSANTLTKSEILVNDNNNDEIEVSKEISNLATEINPSYNAEYDSSDTEILNIQSEEYKEAALEHANLLISKFFADLAKFTYYFTLKSHVISQIVYSTSNLTDMLMKISDLREKLILINLNLNKVSNLIDIKYNKYEFSKDYRLNLTNPFRNETKEDSKLIDKYRDVIEAKIAEVDTIEKEREQVAEKLANIKNMKPEVREAVEKELAKISSVNYESENGKRFEYLNHIISLPWDKKDTPKWDINYAKEILDKNLYGLEETKQRIYEFIAKNMRTNNRKGCVLLLTGGPGTGKTRIAKLIGEALQRKVGFVSLAGISDGKTVLGFKRTYISSTPGLFIREMQKVNTINPVIVIDEIDKINIKYGSSNVFNALLQLLNPEENSQFRDHYLEVPFDFSNVIFILTSNNNEIFTPLLDRMEVIKVDPYVYYEKFLIAKNYALKQILADYHLEDLEFTDKAIYDLIFHYCKQEAGVRKLKKLLENIVRKITAKIELGEISDLLKENIDLHKTNKLITSNDSKEDTIDQKELLKYLQINSNNIFKILDEANDDDTVLSNITANRHVNGESGSCVGLFVVKTDQLNSWGDASIFSVHLTEKKHKKLEFGNQLDNLLKNMKKQSSNIDCDIDSKIDDEDSTNKEDKKKKEKENLLKEKSLKYSTVITGNLGEDSIQSLNIAIELAGEMLNKINNKKYENYFYNKEIHYGSPIILQPKSGPSAGVVAFLCLMSSALKKPIIPNLAMTGEVAIDGSVLKIGGVKEKCQGAQRYGVTTLSLPIGNKNDFMSLQDNLKNSFKKVYFAKHVEEIYEIGLGGNTENIDCFTGSQEDNALQIEEEVILKNNLLDNLF